MNHGMPAIPARAYSASESSPRLAPSEAPTRSAAKVWPVTGTGEPGTGTAIWAAMPVSAAPPSTSAASRTRAREAVAVEAADRRGLRRDE